MIFRIAGGIAFFLQGLSLVGIGGIPPVIIGAFAIAAGIGLLAGI